ncbi:MAG: hypothetical protein AAFY70_05870, partial [Bacteroidota bacterium]
MISELKLRYFKAEQVIGEGKYKLWHPVSKEHDLVSKYWIDVIEGVLNNKISENGIAIDIAFIDTHSLFNRNILTRLLKAEIKERTQEDFLYRLTTDTHTHQFKLPPSDPHPIIFMGTDDIMEATQSTSSSKQGRIIRKNHIDYLHQRIDPRFRFMDSSIWHRYLSIFPAETFAERLTSLIKEIVTYSESGLYKATVAQEYLEFQCRKLRESYVKDYPGGHAKKVIPFRFHSESKMKALSSKERGLIKEFKWSCLLVDDYAHKGLRMDEKQRKDARLVNKRDWINRLINDGGEDLLVFLNENPREEPLNEEDWLWVKHDTKRPLEGFIQYFLNLLNDMGSSDSPRRPDVLILDYFFGIEEMDPEQQYGHKFIRQLKEGYIPSEEKEEENNELHDKKGKQLHPRTRAFGKYWIFPISAFEYAFRSHLRLMGDSTNLSHIEIGDGADPINSPELFRYLLFSFLRYQKEQITISLEEVKPRIEFELELLKAGNEDASDTDKPEDIIDFDKLQTILSRYYYWMVDFTNRLLRLNQEKLHSQLAQSYLREESDEEHLLKAAIIHFQTMIQLITYGTKWDAPRIWKEFKILKKLEKQAESLSQDAQHTGSYSNPISQLLDEKIMKSIAYHLFKEF